MHLKIDEEEKQSNERPIDQFLRQDLRVRPDILTKQVTQRNDRIAGELFNRKFWPHETETHFQQLNIFKTKMTRFRSKLKLSKSFWTESFRMSHLCQS